MYEASDPTWLMENGYDQFASNEVINGEWIAKIIKIVLISLIYIRIHKTNILMQWGPTVRRQQSYRGKLRKGPKRLKPIDKV